MNLPSDFIKQMKALLGGGFSAFMDSFLEPAWRGAHFSIRRGPLIIPGWAGNEIPWAQDAFYVSSDASPGAHPHHWAGRYYLQEPSAMAAVSALDVRPGERVLDLCAAPGGKSSQIVNCLQGRGLLVANEPYAARARELSRNIERMGIANSIVTNCLPERLAAIFPDYFDKILVDAPCSGEGMFRKEPEVIKYWHKDLPKQNAALQKQIVNQAARMLKPGGKMVYSTCTFNETENEAVVETFLRENPDFHLRSFSLPGLPESGMGLLRLWPHQMKGEGHFIALFEKDGDAPLQKNSAAVKLIPRLKNKIDNWVSEPILADGQLGETVVSLPEDCPDLSGIKVLRLGLHLMNKVGKTEHPDHALALAKTPLQMVSLSLEEAEQYRLGMPIQIQDHYQGFMAACLDGWPLGWGKASQGILKNHYPKGLRKPG